MKRTYPSPGRHGRNFPPGAQVGQFEASSATCDPRGCPHDTVVAKEKPVFWVRLDVPQSPCPSCGGPTLLLLDAKAIYESWKPAEFVLPDEVVTVCAAVGKLIE